VVCLHARQCRGAAATLFRSQLLRIASEAGLLPHLSVQRRHAVQQRVIDRWLRTNTSSQLIPHLSVQRKHAVQQRVTDRWLRTNTSSQLIPHHVQRNVQISTFSTDYM
jgi:hypothetical protein